MSKKIPDYSEEPILATKEISEFDIALQKLLDATESGVDDAALVVLTSNLINSATHDVVEDEIEPDSYYDDYDWELPKKTPQEVRDQAARDFLVSKIKEAKEVEMPAELAELEEDYLKWREILMVRIFNAKWWPDHSFNAERTGKKKQSGWKR